MKKISILLVALLLLITGCGKKDTSSIIKDFEKKINKSKSYEIIGVMEITNNDDIYKYNVNVKYLDDDIEYYKVDLINQSNNHEQIILKNNEGVYVITPSLNKSFKFQSDWPDNSSQSYILKSILNDMKKDNKASIYEKDGKYIVKNKVEYPNNEDLTYEKVYFKKDMLPEKVEVYNSDDNLKIKVIFSKIDLKKNVDNDEFELSNLIKEDACDEECRNKKKEENEQKSNESGENNNPSMNKQTTELDDIVYPLYVPENTALKSKDVINTEEGQRVILTFAGDSSFVLVEEPTSVNSEFEIIPVYGNPEIINDSVGALSSNSLSWSTSTMNYYLTGTDLSQKELVTIANSISNIGTVSLEK